MDIYDKRKMSFTYDHRTLKTRLPVRSALFKQRTGGLVVRWVTTSEYPLLYVFAEILHLSVSKSKPRSLDFGMKALDVGVGFFSHVLFE